MSQIESIEITGAKLAKFDFDIDIAAGRTQVWTLLTTLIDTWWTADFRALGSHSQVSLDPQVGGLLVEQTADGAALEWYRVQMVIPGQSLYLVGCLAPDWGGPAVSMLKLSLEGDDQHCVLTVSDALTGNVSEKKAQQVKSGWQSLFNEGLKRAAETTNEN